MSPETLVFYHITTRCQNPENNDLKQVSAVFHPPLFPYEICNPLKTTSPFPLFDRA